MFWLFWLFLCFEFKLNTSEGQGYWGKRLRLWQTAPRLRCRSCGRCFFLFHLLGLEEQKTKHSKQHPQHPQQRFSRASLCTPAAASLAVRNLMNKPSSPKLQHPIFIHSLHLRCPSARSKMSSMLSTIRLKFFRSSHGFSTSLAGNLFFSFSMARFCRLRRVRTQNWEILRSKLFCHTELSFQRASESGTMQRCAKRASQNAVHLKWFQLQSSDNTWVGQSESF